MTQAKANMNLTDCQDIFANLKIYRYAVMSIL